MSLMIQGKSARASAGLQCPMSLLFCGVLNAGMSVSYACIFTDV